MYWVFKSCYEHRFLKQVDSKWSKLVFKLQILPDNGDVTFYNDKNGKRLSLLKFPSTAILYFISSVSCHVQYAFSDWLQSDLQPLNKINKIALEIIAHMKHTYSILVNQPAEVL